MAARAATSGGDTGLLVVAAALGIGGILILASKGGLGSKNKPGAPTMVSATAGDGRADVAWLAPASDGGSPITSYLVTASPGGLTMSWTSGAFLLGFTGLTNGTAYTFTVAAANAIGTGPASAPSAPVTPTKGLPPRVTGFKAAGAASGVIIPVAPRVTLFKTSVAAAGTVVPVPTVTGFKAAGAATGVVFGPPTVTLFKAAAAAV